MIIRNRKNDLTPNDKPYVCVDNDSLMSSFSKQSDWQFRIYAQMLYRSEQHYNWYFFTLTFSDKFIPRFRFHEFECQCFSRTYIHRFLRGIQMDLLKKYNVTDYDYLVACEYGKQNSFRGHHHGVMGVPDSVTPKQVHELIVKHWSVLTGRYYKDGKPERQPLGYVLPRVFSGGYDAKGKFHKPLLIDPQNYDSASIYVSKYVCKQVGFFQNSKVKELQAAVNNRGTIQDKRKFKNVCPFIYPSLHFGECIKDWVLGVNLPKSKAISVDPDWRVNLYEGIYTPLRRKSKTRIPSYIKRKLIFNCIRESEVVTYKKFYCDDSFKCDYSLFDEDLTEEVRPPLKIKSTQYSYDSVYSDLAFQYLPYEYDRKIKSKIELFNSLDLTVDNEHFVDFLKGKLNDSQIDIFFSILGNYTSRQIAVYAVVYRSCVSPLHYWRYLTHRDDFRNQLRIEEYVAEITNFWGKKKYIDTECFLTDFWEYSTTFCDFDPIEAKLDGFEGVTFTGRETIDMMIDKAKAFYLDRLNYISRVSHHNEIPETFNVFFNSFPCFRYIDLLLSIIEDYSMFVNEQKLKKIHNDYEHKQELKNNFYNI